MTGSPAAILIAGLLTVAAQAQNATSVFKVIPTPNGHPKPFQNDLHSVSASSRSDIWAVGQTAIHFSGSKWTAFAMPDIHGDNTSRIGGVVDLAPNNVWAVGLINIGLQNPNQVIEHFDGTAWSIAAGPTFQPNDQPSLESITAISPSDMWATGFILTDNFQALFPLFEHYDGTSWTASETQFSDGTMFGVSADATNDVWAVGTVALGATIIEHYDGTTWSVVPSPSPGLGFNILEGVKVLAPNDVWAVGYYTKDVNSTRPSLTLVEHYDGTSWKIVPSPNVGPKRVSIERALRGHSGFGPRHMGLRILFCAERLGAAIDAGRALGWDELENCTESESFAGRISERHFVWRDGDSHGRRAAGGE